MFLHTNLVGANMPYEYILAILFLLSPERPPQLVAPAPDQITCFKMAGKLAVEHKDTLVAQAAAPVCLKIEVPTV